MSADPRFDTESPGLTIAQLRGLTCARCGMGFRPQLRPGQTGADHERPFIDGGIVGMNDGGRMTWYHGYVGKPGCFERAMLEMTEVERFDRSPGAEQHKSPGEQG